MVKGAILKGWTQEAVATAAKCTFAVTAYYDFAEQADAEAWLAHFAEAADGLKLLTESAGCSLVKLMKVTDSSTKVGTYQEWESEDAYRSFAAARAESGYLAQWFGFDSGSGQYTKLKLEKPMVHGFSMIMTDEKVGAVL